MIVVATVSHDNISSYKKLVCKYNTYMNSLWDEKEAGRCVGELELRAWSSRLLGSEKALVMVGGGNTSVKLREDGEDILYIKGSGADLAHVTEKDFAPVRLAAVKRLIERDAMSNAEMAVEFRAALANPKAPRPSIETLLHAILPFKWVEHTHADAVLAVANTDHGERHIRAALGDAVLIVPYHNSGFELAKACHEVFSREATANTIGMVLMHHGLFAFGDNARESYERMIALVTRAEDYLKSCCAGDIPLRFPPAQAASGQGMLALAALRRDISRAAGFPLVMTLSSDLMSLAFARRPDLESLSQRGPATPHHAVFTKRVPMLGRDVAAFTAAYRRYLAQNAPEQAERLPDVAPRIVLDPEWGLISAGITAFYADAAAEIYRHSMKIQSRAEALEAYASLPPREVLAAEIEYGGFEQTMRNQYALAGQVVLVDRALSNQAKVEELLAKGAAVIGLDNDPAVKTLHPQPEYLGLCCGLADSQIEADGCRSGLARDQRHPSRASPLLPNLSNPVDRPLYNPTEIAAALELSVRRFGGIDRLLGGDALLQEMCRPLLALSPLQSE
ncbi:MAG: bifunctional aldolase/short-chain dehydrogenase [Hydrogenophilales bacterium CG_4_9_14_3_um_filter_59_35]|nr:MAG: bifunctional aldolase/short-chain dehydrogenase [Hydrogenophilales bacterium CG18_big_fil_WC_8_21_14_2_50_58_12]PIY02010.1 MAG: bifunctional aldolase/short-chain dehydrogenase [Hydrogenophilales bacterium CG_4_10_14_3_um_filter_58_23]PJB06640.1 MAG: bifunctional aldolase/short-chain dehydrogenase [Hydrogenophilales bacterium CG_4_9_14_3_um_filter_59_35]